MAFTFAAFCYIAALVLTGKRFMIFKIQGFKIDLDKRNLKSNQSGFDIFRNMAFDCI